MQATDFLARLHSTPLYTAEQKDYFTARVNQYDDDQREKLVVLIDKYEQKLISLGQKRKQAKNTKLRSQMQQEMREITIKSEQQHRAETTQAEDEINTALNTL